MPKDKVLNEKKVSKKVTVNRNVKRVKDKAKNKVKKAEKNNVKKLNKTKPKNIPVKPNYLLEYYDLPYRYNETVVKILAQTPKRLFVYWEISDKDKQTYLNAFGEDFFEKTYPVLLVHNEKLNYTVEVPINDFANSWYLDINDPKTKYVVQLGRKFKNVSEIKTSQEVIQKENINIQNDFVYITDSNKLEVPNDHVLFEKLENQISYKNIKTGVETEKDISTVIEKLPSTYKNVKPEDIYKEIYGENIELVNNPSSGALSRV